jgi:hypothetical protein
VRNDLDRCDSVEKYKVEGKEPPEKVAGNPEEYTCGMSRSLPDRHLLTRFPTRFTTQ